MNANKMTCIHYQSIANPWMDCLVYVPTEFKYKALVAVQNGVEVFNDDDNQETYGQCIELELESKNIPYLIEYGEYDEHTDEPYPSWEAHVNEVENCEGLNILLVEYQEKEWML